MDLERHVLRADPNLELLLALSILLWPLGVVLPAGRDARAVKAIVSELQGTVGRAVVDALDDV